MLLCSYNGLVGTHIKVTEFVRDTDCLVCGPGTLIELDTSSTLSEVSNTLNFKPCMPCAHSLHIMKGTSVCEGLRCLLC